MAYPYFPVYQPYPVQQPMQSNAFATQMNVAPTQPTQPTGIIWVSGPQEAQMYPIAPNNAVTLWDRSGKSVYVKTADATGKPSITVYDLTERKITASDAISEQDGKLPAYATKDELAAATDALKGLDELIAGIRADIDTMKGDLYGIAGKKKGRKPEAENDE